jgi:predicted nucleic acid-binding protein
LAKRIVINDTSCLVDLRKGGLIEPMLALPFRFVVTYNVRVSELLEFGEAEWRRLEALGMETIDPPSDQVAAAGAVMAENRKLSFEDSLNFVVARANQLSILLTGDRALRTVAERSGIDVHGILWIVEQLLEHRLADRSDLVDALQRWRADPTVFVPAQLIEAMIAKCKA